MLHASKKALQSFFTAHEARYDFEFSLGSASENGHNTPKARYDCGPRYWKCQISLSHGLETVENSEDLTRLPKSRLLLLGNGARVSDGDKGSRTTSAAFTLGARVLDRDKASRITFPAFFHSGRFPHKMLDDVHRTTQKMPHFAVNHAWDQK